MSHDRKTPIDSDYTPVESEKNRYDGFYETGRTRPPKGYSGLVAVLMVCILSATVFVCVLQSSYSDPQPSETGEPTIQTNEALPFLPKASENTVPHTDAGLRLHLDQVPEDVPNVPQAGGLSLQEIYRKVSPSVAAVLGTRQNGVVDSLGSAVVVSKSGYLVTSCNLVHNATEIFVTLSDESQHPAVLMGYDFYSDLAILKIDVPQALTPAEFGDSDAMQVGDCLTTVGFSNGPSFRSTLREGILSGTAQSALCSQPISLMETSLPFSQGDQGAPILNAYGQVVGLRTDGAAISGFPGPNAVLSSLSLEPLVNSLLQKGYVEGRPDPGLDITELEDMFQFIYNMPKGLYVTQVLPDTPAAKAGILPGDVLTQINGVPLSTMDQANTIMAQMTPGDSVTLQLERLTTVDVMERTIVLGEAHGRDLNAIQFVLPILPEIPKIPAAE